MIAPTTLYEAFPALSADQAADMVMKAVIERPKRVATGLGVLGAVAQAVAPGISEFVLNQAYHLFPDSPAAKGMGATDVNTPSGRMPRNPVALARQVFSKVFGSVHW
jgi:hypothetical protein